MRSAPEEEGPLRAAGAPVAAPAWDRSDTRADPDEPAWMALREYAAAQARVLVEEDHAARRSDTEAVPRIRLAARRLQGALETFRPLLEAGWRLWRQAAEEADRLRYAVEAGTPLLGVEAEAFADRLEALPATLVTHRDALDSAAAARAAAATPRIAPSTSFALGAVYAAERAAAAATSGELAELWPR